jgi:hypothetical protein
MMFDNRYLAIAAGLLIFAILYAIVYFPIQYRKNQKNKKDAEAFARLQAEQREGLIKAEAEREEKRKQAIRARRAEWGDAFCLAVYKHEVAIDMTPEMVKLSWGEPGDIDNKEVTKKGLVKERWIYGTPRKDARYVYFSEGKVQKIQT